MKLPVRQDTSASLNPARARVMAEPSLADKIWALGAVTLRHTSNLHHIGVGRAHTGTEVLILTRDLYIRIISTTTGELLRELTLDPSRDYQLTGKAPAQKRVP